MHMYELMNEDELCESVWLRSVSVCVYKLRREFCLIRCRKRKHTATQPKENYYENEYNNNSDNNNNTCCMNVFVVVGLHSLPHLSLSLVHSSVAVVKHLGIELLRKMTHFAMH